MKENKILVTGGGGFIGSHLVKKLVKLGKEVGVVDDFSRGSRNNLKSVIKKIKVYKKDLRNESGLLKIFEDYELVFNLAALNTGVDYDEGRTQLMFEDNMLLQMIPLRVSGKTKSVKKFIQISSASVYSRDAMENQIPTKETANTANPEPSKLGYGLAKKMGENLAYWYAKNSNLHTCSARFINVYGENDHFDNLGHFIPMMIRKVIEAKEKVDVFGSGKQKRSFIYVEDAVSALINLAEKGKSGESYNIDSEDEKTIKSVVKNICSFLERDISLNFDMNKPEGSKRRLLDSSKIRSLGWRPVTSFQDGLKRTVLDIEKRLKDNHY